jgi:hypothetical protein
VNDTCVLVYKSQWNQVKLLKESDKWSCGDYGQKH